MRKAALFAAVAAASLAVACTQPEEDVEIDDAPVVEGGGSADVESNSNDDDGSGDDDGEEGGEGDDGASTPPDRSFSVTATEVDDIIENMGDAKPGEEGAPPATDGVASDKPLEDAPPEGGGKAEGLEGPDDHSELTPVDDPVENADAGEFIEEGRTLLATNGGPLASLFGGDGAPRVTFGASERNGDDQILRDVVINTDDENVSVDSMQILGARTENGVDVFDALTFQGLRVSDEEGSLTVGRLSLVGPNLAAAELVNRMMSDDEFADDIDLRLASEYAFEAFEVEGVQLAINDDGEAVQFALASLSATDWADGVLGGFRVQDFELATSGSAGDDKDYGDPEPPVNLRLDEWSIDGLDLTILDALTDDDDLSPEQRAQAAFAASTFSDPFQQHYDNFSLRGFELSVEGLNLALGEAVGQTESTRGGLRSGGGFNNLTVEFDPEGEIGAQALDGLSQMGYDRLEFSGDFEQLADGVNDRVHSQQYVIRMVDGFQLHADYDFGGMAEYVRNMADMQSDMFLNDDFDFGDVAEMGDLYSALTINGFELRLVDDSITERGLLLAGAMMGGGGGGKDGEPAGDPGAIAEQAAAFIQAGAYMAPQGPQRNFAVSAAASIGDFLRNPGTLTVRVNPAQPVSVATLMEAGEDEALNLLNPSVTATPPE